MTDSDDSATWLSSAIRHAELAAHQIARFTNPWWDPTWRDLVPYDPPPPLAVGWTTRGRRSRSAKKASNAAAAAAECSCSPEAPFDFGSGSGLGCRSGSGASTSGGEDGFGFSKKRRVGYGGDVSGSCEMKPGPISVAKDIRRADKKKTLYELQAEERLLLEKKNQLQKEMEMKMKAIEGLRAENQRLKSQQVSFHSETISVRTATVCPSFESPSSNTRFILPDLNEPLSENFD